MSEIRWKSPNLSPPPDAFLDSPPEGYSLVDLFPEGRRPPKFVSGDPESVRVRLRYFANAEKTRLQVKAWYGPGAEGPPLHAHGGSIAAVLDESMGGVAWIQDLRCLAAQINIQFRKALPLGTLVWVHSWIEKIEGRKIYSCARMESEQGQLFAEGTGLFIQLDRESMKKALGSGTENSS